MAENRAEHVLGILTATADRIGWPVFWRDDLTVHDARILRENRDELVDRGFVWVLRECGTHLAWGWGSGADAVLTVFGKAPHRWFVWTGDRLRELDNGDPARLRAKVERFLRTIDREAGRDPIPPSSDGWPAAGRCA